MDGMAKIGRELMGLDRIVAVLLVLACLAVHAAAAPRPVRRALLWGLRRADAAVKDFAARYAFRRGLPPRPVATPHDGDDREAALSLARSLRMLAALFADMVARLRRRPFLLAGQAPAGNDPARRLRLDRAAGGGGPDVRAAGPDTS